MKEVGSLRSASELVAFVMINVAGWSLMHDHHSDQAKQLEVETIHALLRAYAIAKMASAPRLESLTPHQREAVLNMKAILGMSNDAEIIRILATHDWNADHAINTMLAVDPHDQRAAFAQPPTQPSRASVAYAESKQTAGVPAMAVRAVQSQSSATSSASASSAAAAAPAAPSRPARLL